MGRTKDIEKYMDYLIEEELSEGTRTIYVREARQMEEYLSGRSVSKKLMVDYKKYLGTLEIAQSTQNLKIVAVNRYLKFLGCRDCMIKPNRIQAGQSLEDVITMEEYKELLTYAKESGRDKYYAIIKTLAMTGIRISELKYFTVEALEKKFIRITNKKKTREICLPDNLVKVLSDYCHRAGNDSGVIFRGKGEQPISRIAVYQMLVKMADEIGIKKGKVHPHSFRHLFAITYMVHFSNLFELADLLGHSSLETTRIYARSTLKERGQKMNELGL